MLRLTQKEASSSVLLALCEESVSISSPRPVFLHSRQAVITNLKTFPNTTGKDSYVPRLLWGECIGDQRCPITKDKLGVKCVRVMIPSCFFPQSTGRHHKFGDVLQYRRQGFRWLLDNRRIDPSSTERGLSRNRKWDQGKWKCYYSEDTSYRRNYSANQLFL